MIEKIKAKKRLLIFCMAVFCAFILIFGVCLLFAGRGRDKGSAGSPAAAASGDPAMIVVDPESGSGENAYDDTDQVYEPGSLDAEDEASAEDLKNRLEEKKGLLPEHGTGYIFIGDSRFVHMDQVCDISDNENLFVVAKVGEGYSWFTGKALPQVKSIVSSGLFENWKIVICLGINDLENLEKYKLKYDELMEDYDITLVSVNPITSYGSLSNEKIESFNAGIQETGLPYIDIYRLLMLTGYTTTDGLHYDADTSDKIFTGILMGLEDEGSAVLAANTGSVLNSSALSRRNALQKGILEENSSAAKYEVSTDILPSLAVNTGQAVENADNADAGQNAGTESAPPASEPAAYELTQEDIDALYGITRDDESSHDEEDGHEDDDD